MLANASKYIIAALALICMALGVTIAIQEVRLERIKSELKETVLERDSLSALAASQSERLAKLNTLLKDAENACLKRLDARRAVNEIFKKEISCLLTTQQQSSTPGAAAVPIIITDDAPQNNTQDNYNENFVSFETSVLSIRHINDSLRLFRQADNF